jgi:hypothetical protein
MHQLFKPLSVYSLATLPQMIFLRSKKVKANQILKHINKVVILLEEL